MIAMVDAYLIQTASVGCGPYNAHYLSKTPSKRPETSIYPDNPSGVVYDGE